VTDGILSRPYRAATVGIVGLISLIAFETIAVATALPTAVRELDGLAWYGWSFTALLVTSVVGMVAAGELTDRVGGRLPLLVGVGAFLAGLLTAGLAPDMAVFLAGRALQGVGVGLLIVVMYVIVGDQYPERLRPTVFGAISAAWVIPSLVGPVLAGALAQGPGWRWVFLGLVPLVAAAVVSLVPTLRRLRRPDNPAPARPGRRVAAVATALGVAAVQWSLQELGWPQVPALAGGLVLLGLGLRALVPRGTVALRRGVPAVVGLRGLLAGAFMSVESLVPLTLTLVHGYPPTAAGAPLTFGALGWAAATFWQGRRPDAARHRLVRTGFLLVGAAAAGMAVVAQPWSPAWVIYPVWVAGGCGMGLAMSSLSVLLLSFSPPAERGVNSSALQLSDSVASALCIGLAGALVAASARGLLPLDRAVGALDLLMLAVVLAGAVLAGRARRPTPRERAAAPAPPTPTRTAAT
jgi:MFS family permease